MTYKEWKRMQESEEKLESNEGDYTISSNGVIHVNPIELLMSDKIKKYLK